MLAPLGRGTFPSPLEQLDLECLTTEHPLEVRASYSWIRPPPLPVQGAGLELPDPDPDQLARNVVAFGECMQGLEREQLLRDLRLNPALWGDCMASILRKPSKGTNPKRLTCTIPKGALQWGDKVEAN